MVRWLAATAALLVAGGIVLARVPADALLPVTVAVFAATGAVLATKRPDNAIGWVFLVAGVLLGTSGVADGWLRTQAPAGSLGTAPARVLFAVTFFPGFTLVLVPLLLLFPTGRPPTRRWRWALWAAAVFAILAAAGNALPEGSALGEALVGLAVLPLFPALGAGVAAVWVRYRRGDQTERRQLKWFLLSASLLPVAFVAGDIYQDHPWLSGAILSAGLIQLPVAAAVAVLRYRLYEIDRIVSRTVTYAVVTALLVGVYAVVAVLPSALLRLESDLLVAGATLAVAAAFGPVRRKVQVGVDRRFNRSRYDAARVVDGFATHLRQQLDLGDLAGDLTAAVRKTVQPASVSLWLPPGRPG